MMPVPKLSLLRGQEGKLFFDGKEIKVVQNVMLHPAALTQKQAAALKMYGPPLTREYVATTQEDISAIHQMKVPSAAEGGWLVPKEARDKERDLLRPLRASPPINVLAELFQCQEGEFYCSDTWLRQYEHWSGLDVSGEFIEDALHRAEIARAFHRYLEDLPQKERDERRQRFDAMQEGKQFLGEFCLWLQEKTGGRQWIPELMGDWNIDEVMPPIPRDIQRRFYEARKAITSYREWKQQHQVVMICELLPASPSIRERWRCWVEERQCVPNHTLDAAWERMFKSLEMIRHKRRIN